MFLESWHHKVIVFPDSWPCVLGSFSFTLSGTQRSHVVLVCGSSRAREAVTSPQVLATQYTCRLPHCSLQIHLVLQELSKYKAFHLLFFFFCITEENWEENLHTEWNSLVAFFLQNDWKFKRIAYKCDMYCFFIENQTEFSNPALEHLCVISKVAPAQIVLSQDLQFSDHSTEWREQQVGHKAALLSHCNTAHITHRAESHHMLPTGLQLLSPASNADLSGSNPVLSPTHLQIMWENSHAGVEGLGGAQICASSDGPQKNEHTPVCSLRARPLRLYMFIQGLHFHVTTSRPAACCLKQPLTGCVQCSGPYCRLSAPFLSFGFAWLFS